MTKKKTPKKASKPRALRALKVGDLVTIKGKPMRVVKVRNG